MILDASPLDGDPEGTALLRALIQDDKKARAARARTAPAKPGEPVPAKSAAPARPFAPLSCPAGEPRS